MISSRPVDEWVSRLSLPDAGAREEALEAVGEALSAEDLGLRERTAQFLLQELARPGATTHGPILALLQADWWPPPTRLAVSAVQAVTEALTRMEVGAPGVKDAALVLANLYRVEPAVLPSLGTLLDHAHPAVRRAVASMVGRTGPDGVSLLPRLITRLEDEEAVATAALESLGALGPLAPELAAPALLEQARKTQGRRRHVVLSALRGMVEQERRGGRPMPALGDLEPVLLPALADPDPAVRVEAVSLLGLTGPRSPGALTLLRGILKDANAAVAACAAVALLRSGPAPHEALSLLQGQLTSVDLPQVQGAALSALEEVEHAVLIQAKGVLEKVARDIQGPVGEGVRELLVQLG